MFSTYYVKLFIFFVVIGPINLFSADFFGGTILNPFTPKKVKPKTPPRERLQRVVNCFKNNNPSLEKVTTCLREDRKYVESRNRELFYTELPKLTEELKAKCDDLNRKYPHHTLTSLTIINNLPRTS